MIRSATLSMTLVAGIAAAAPAATAPQPAVAQPAVAPPAVAPAPKASVPSKPAATSKAPTPVAAPPPPATQPGRVARTTDLRDKPGNDGAMLQVVQANTVVEVAERQGGWYKVTVGGVAGWMRLSAIRFGTPVASSGGGSATLGFLQSGRSAVTSGTVTTGVRGLSEEGLAKAEPNYTAVASLDALAVTGDDARLYASEAPAVAVKVDYVAAPEKEKKKKGKSGGGG